MRTQTLCGVWQVSFRHPKTGKQHTIPAAVPGNVGADLMRAKVVPDLYRKRNVLQAQEWERTDFIYATSFVAPALKQGERLELHFEGVDTAATVALNGRPSFLRQAPSMSSGSSNMVRRPFRRGFHRSAQRAGGGWIARL